MFIFVYYNLPIYIAKTSEFIVLLNVNLPFTSTKTQTMPQAVLGNTAKHFGGTFVEVTR